MRSVIFSILIAVFTFSCSSGNEDIALHDAGMDATQGSIHDLIQDLVQDLMDHSDIADVQSSDADASFTDMVEDMAVTQNHFELIQIKDNKKYEFDEFYFGENKDGSLQFEILLKGQGKCPSMQDPTPDLTLVFLIHPETQIHSNPVLLDFKGLFETVSPTHKSTMVVSDFTYNKKANITAMNAQISDSHSPSHFNISGNFQATHCVSLDEQ